MNRETRTFILGLIMVAMGGVVLAHLFIEIIKGLFEYKNIINWVAMLGSLGITGSGINKLDKTTD